MYVKAMPTRQSNGILVDAFLANSTFFFSTDYEPSSNSTRRNTRDSKRADRAILRWIRRHPAYVKLQWAFPRWVTVRLKPLLRKRVDIKIEWTKDAREYATSLVREEVGPLLAFCNKPSDYWTLD